MVDNQRLLRVNTFALWSLMGGVPLTVWACCTEWQTRSIPNVIPGLFLAVFALAATQLSVNDIAVRLLAGLGAGGLAYVLWYFGRIGGGDVKLTVALVPFVEPHLWGFFFVMLVGWSGLVHVLVRQVQNEPDLPFGIPLALSAVSVLILSL